MYMYKFIYIHIYIYICIYIYMSYFQKLKWDDDLHMDPVVATLCFETMTIFG